ncbi:DNA replication protein psf2 [Tilletia horrida]|nr:DNA replication protein psf2 [Tilletia horrida]
MALPRSLASGLLPSEIEYIASTETEVSIVPLLAFDRVRLLGGIYGPFRPPAQTKVPLWLAAYLKRRNKCVIVPPAWLTVEALTETLRIETNTASFAEVPFHYVAVAKVLLDVAADDIPSSDQVRALLKDLREARQSKIMAGLEMINPVHLEMTNISALEIAELRPFFGTAFRELRAFQRNAAIANGELQQFGAGSSANANANAHLYEFDDYAKPAGGKRAGGAGDGAGAGGPGYGTGGFDFGPGIGDDEMMDYDGGATGRFGDTGDDDNDLDKGGAAAGRGDDEAARRGYTTRGRGSGAGAGDDASREEEGDEGEEDDDESGPGARRAARPMVEEYEMD